MGGCSPPVPKKLADKICNGEFIELEQLLPANLGAPEPTMFDLLAHRNRPLKPAKIESFAQWITCFNTYVSVLATHHPERVRDLLAYASLLAKASMEYEGTPWLVYDQHFRRQAATLGRLDWAQADPHLWTLYFRQPKSLEGAQDHMARGRTNEVSKIRMRRRQAPDQPYEFPICRNWNFSKCTSASCRYRHICLDCRVGGHKAGSTDCPNSKHLKGESYFRPPPL